MVDPAQPRMTCAFPTVRKNYLARRCCTHRSLRVLDKTEQCCGVCLPTLTSRGSATCPIKSTTRRKPRAPEEPGLGSAKPTSAGAPAGWPAPDPSLLEDGRPVVPAFPLDALPQPWREWVSDTACGAGAPVDYVAQAVLGAVAGLCGAGVKACVTQSWSEPLVLWQALVGAPSAGKTPALDAIGRPLASVEKLLQRDAGGGASPVQALASPVQGGRIVVRDAALAALTRSVAARPPGVLLWRDEPTPWLYALARETRHDRPRGPFIDAWSAGSNLPVSVLCSLHPDGLAEALEGTPDGWPRAFSSPGPAHRHSAAFRRQAAARRRGGDDAASHWRRGRHARPAADARLPRGSGEELRPFPHLAAGGDPRHRGSRGRLAGQGAGHGCAPCRNLRAARLVTPCRDGEAARHRPGAITWRQRPACGGTTSGRMAAPCSIGALLPISSARCAALSAG